MTPFQKIPRLEEELQHSRKAHSALEADHERLNQDYLKLRETYINLQEDFNSQQQIANDIRNEATHLLDEIKNLQRKNQELVGAREEDQRSIQKLREELASAKEAAATALSPPPASIVSSAPSNRTGAQNRRESHESNATQRDSGPIWNKPAAPQIVSSKASPVQPIHTDKLDAYEQAVDDLMKASKYESLFMLRLLLT